MDILHGYPPFACTKSTLVGGPVGKSVTASAARDAYRRQDLLQHRKNTHMTTHASTIKRLLSSSLIAAGFALGAIGASAVAHADRNSDIEDYFACLVEHTPSDETVDDVTDETCCILHNGKMVNGHCDLILEQAQPTAPAGRRVLTEHPDLANAPAVTAVPTKQPSVSLGR